MLVPETRPIIPAKTEVETFSVSLPWLLNSDGLRLDAGFYNRRAAEALTILQKSGLTLRPLGGVTERIFIPPWTKRIWVDKDHGVPFLQGSHIVQSQPADLKFLSRTAHKHVERYIIGAGWVLVTCSGTIGRVRIAPTTWNGWAASQHILRIVPDPKSPCPGGYIYAYLASELGQAQLTSRVYGAVVDEITEGQAQSVLIPVPVTPDQKRQVEEINEKAMEAVRLSEEGVKAANEAVSGATSFVPKRSHPKKTVIEN